MKNVSMTAEKNEREEYQIGKIIFRNSREWGIFASVYCAKFARRRVVMLSHTKYNEARI